ncbi:hypothetical protein, partial [Glaesserella parasuis]|uniref:hypothetical protein n=1 Tax=Glaesserella parasuis TaxID=738 RepID=UPI00272079DE|nr:hypothetical protein [Glaesserella parasuis]
FWHSFFSVVECDYTFDLIPLFAKEGSEIEENFLFISLIKISYKRSHLHKILQISLQTSPLITLSPFSIHQ